MNIPFPVNRELSDRQFEEYQRNRSLEEKNLAGISYARRDFYYYIERSNTLIESENAKMMGFIHNYSNQNLSKLELMGHNHPNANLLKHYKRSRILVDNDQEIVTDLQRLFCKTCVFSILKCMEIASLNINIMVISKYLMMLITFMIMKVSRRK